MGAVIERMLIVYGGASEEVISVFRLSRFDLSTFMQQFDVDPRTDPDMYNSYSVGPDDTSFVVGHLEDEVEFDFQKRAYFIEAISNDLS